MDGRLVGTGGFAFHGGGVATKLVEGRVIGARDTVSSVRDGGRGLLVAGGRGNHAAGDGEDRPGDASGR